MLGSLFNIHSNFTTFARILALAIRATARPRPTPPPRHRSRSFAQRVGFGSGFNEGSVVLTLAVLTAEPTLYPCMLEHVHECAKCTADSSKIRYYFHLPA
eukprot:6201152-Pleurochrysis_carterae.AAC.1